MYPGATARRVPDKPALIMASNGEVVTHQELDERSNQLAQLFRARGVHHHDSVAIFMENHVRYLECAWAAQRAGLHWTCVNSHLTAPEVEYIVDDCDAKLLISSRTLANVCAQMQRGNTPNVESRLMVDGVPDRPSRAAQNGGLEGWESFDEAVAGYPTGPVADEAEGGFMLYSSGTTGRPKGIWRPLALQPMGEGGMVAGFFSWLGWEGDSTYLCPAPLYHAAPIAWSMGIQRMGGTVVLMERFDAERALQLIEEHQITCAQFVPTMFIRMLKLPQATREKYDVSSLRSVVHAAAPCPVDVKHQMIEWWGPIVYEYYSSTEGAGATTVGPEEWLAHPGTVGKPMLTAAHVLDDDGNELPTGQAGTIWFEGPLGFEYKNDPLKTAEAVNDMGYKTVGDVGYLDEEGYLYLTDRKAYMIISGGVNIYPQEAENVLVLHPKVLDVAVFGVPDPDLGEQVKAVVQPVDWEEAGPELEAELIAHCRSKLAHYKCPRTVDFEPELPRLDTGKLYKKQLRDRYWAGA
ncbi:MAG TPA: AMP-binding protein [Acidimicrobiia bacterium]